MLNSSESNPVYRNQTIGITQNKINPNDFRKVFKEFFSVDLIESYSDETGPKEHLVWIPFWYETLWVYYNRRYVQQADLANIWSMNNKISTLKDQYRDVIPLAIWNWSTVYDSAEIMTQFFMLSWINSIDWLTWNPLKEGLTAYLGYWDVSWNNWYNSRFQEMKTNSRNNVQLFTRGEAHMIIWYPSLVNRIKDAWWFSKNFLEVMPFPHYSSWGWITYANYNYFVINKETLDYELATDLLAYIASDNGATNLLGYYPYYLPALVSLEEEAYNNKVDTDFNITLWDYVYSNYEIWSFKKWIKNVYDAWLVQLLDETNFQEAHYNAWRDKVRCMLTKTQNFTNLSVRCQ